MSESNIESNLENKIKAIGMSEQKFSILDSRYEYKAFFYKFLELINKAYFEDGRLNREIWDLSIKSQHEKYKDPVTGKWTAPIDKVYKEIFFALDDKSKELTRGKTPGSHIKVTCTCPFCTRKFEVILNNITNSYERHRTFGCKFCGDNHENKSRCEPRFSEILTKEQLERYDEKLTGFKASDISYKSYRKIVMHCSKCGKTYTTTPHNVIMYNANRCRNCQIGLSDGNLWSDAATAEQLKLFNTEMTGFGPESISKNSHKTIVMNCYACGKPFKVMARQVILQNQIRCQDCSIKANKGSTSFGEQVALNLFRALNYETLSRHKFTYKGTKLEFDIAVKDLKLLIEYSGDYWHGIKQNNTDELRRQFVKENHVKYIEIIEHPNSLEIYFNGKLIDTIQGRVYTLSVIERLKDCLFNILKIKADINIEEIYNNSLTTSAKDVSFEQSIASIEKLRNEYDTEKNPLKPEQVNFNSVTEVYWKKTVDDKTYSWKATPNSRYQCGTDIPELAKQRIVLSQKITKLALKKIGRDSLNDKEQEQIIRALLSKITVIHTASLSFDPYITQLKSHYFNPDGTAKIENSLNKFLYDYQHAEELKYLYKNSRQDGQGITGLDVIHYIDSSGGRPYKFISSTN